VLLSKPGGERVSAVTLVILLGITDAWPYSFGGNLRLGAFGVVGVL